MFWFHELHFLSVLESVVGTLIRGCRSAISWCDLDLTFDLEL